MKTMTKKQIETAKKVIIAMLATAEAPTAENISKYIKKVSSENKAMYIEYITTALKEAEAEQEAEQTAEQEAEAPTAEEQEAEEQTTAITPFIFNVALKYFKSKNVYAVTINNKLHNNVSAFLLDRRTETETEKLFKNIDRRKAEEQTAKNTVYNNAVNKTIKTVDIYAMQFRTAEAEQEAEAVKVKYNNSDFDSIKEAFYHAYNDYKNIHVGDSIEIKVTENFYIRRTATETDIINIADNYAEAVNDLCMVLVLSVLKKLSNVSRTGRTNKTKSDTNYYFMQKIKNELIASVKGLQKLLYYVENDSTNITAINKLFKQAFASDGIDLISEAKLKLFELIRKAEQQKIKVDLTKNFLDTTFKYTDINKRVWSDISTVTHIKNVTKTEATAEKEAIYTVNYISGKTKVFTGKEAPKTVLDFYAHEEALKNNTYNKKTNLYLVEKETCIATEVFRAVRSYIQEEKTLNTNNSYVYISDVVTFTNEETKEKEAFEVYRKLNDFEKATISDYKATATAEQEEAENFISFMDNLKISDTYKICLKYMLKGYGIRKIAKTTDINENTVRSSVREIKKKLLKSSICIDSKINSIKYAISTLLKAIQTAEAEQTKAEQEKTEAEEVLNKYSTIKDMNISEQKQKRYKVSVINCIDYKINNPVRITVSHIICEQEKKTAIVKRTVLNQIKKSVDVVKETEKIIATTADIIKEKTEEKEITNNDLKNLLKTAVEQNKKQIQKNAVAIHDSLKTSEETIKALEQEKTAKAEAEATEEVKQIIKRYSKAVKTISEATAEKTAEQKKLNTFKNMVYRKKKTEETIANRINYINDIIISAEQEKTEAEKSYMSIMHDTIDKIKEYKKTITTAEIETDRRRKENKKLIRNSINYITTLKCVMHDNTTVFEHEQEATAETVFYTIQNNFKAVFSSAVRKDNIKNHRVNEKETLTYSNIDLSVKYTENKKYIAPISEEAKAKAKVKHDDNINYLSKSVVFPYMLYNVTTPIQTTPTTPTVYKITYYTTTVYSYAVNYLFDIKVDRNYKRYIFKVDKTLTKVNKQFFIDLKNS